jgi:aspartate aminotransferase
MDNRPGQFKEKFSHIKPAPTLPLSQKVKDMKKQGINVIDFGTGDPGFKTPESIIESAYSHMKDGHTHYTSSGGLQELKDEISKKLERDNCLHYSSDKIVITHGAKGAIYNILKILCNPNDEVIVPAPFYPGYLGMIKLVGAKPKVIQTSANNNFKFTTSQLEESVTNKTRLIIINTPTNPTGTVYSREELEALTSFVFNKQIYVISDEIYEKLLFGDKKHYSIASLNKDIKDLVLTVNGFSKTYAMTGWRIGYAAGPEEIISTVTKLQSQSLSCLSPFIQLACVEALKGDQTCVKDMVSCYSKRRDYMSERLSKMGLDFPEPEGAFYVFPNISKFLGTKYAGQIVNDSLDFANMLLEEEKVALLFGPAFGMEGYLRLTFATSNMQEIEEGMDRLERFLTKFKD